MTTTTSQRRKEKEGMREREGGGGGTQRLAGSSGLKGGRNGESSANNKGLTFSLSCCFRSGPLWWTHRQNLIHFLSLDERRASRERTTRKKVKSRGEGKPRRSGPCCNITAARLQTGRPELGPKNLSNLSLIMVGPVLDWVHGFGHSSWIFPKIQYQVQIRSSLVLESFHDTTTRVVGASRR